MPSKSQHVYCYRIGRRELFRVGRTKVDPETRKKGWATGSWEKAALYQDIPTDNAKGLEKYIHELMDPWRTENGDFFKVNCEQLNQAVDEAIEFMKEHKLLTEEASRLNRTRPNDAVVEATEEALALYRQLRAADRDMYLLKRRIELLQSKMKVAIGGNLGIKGVASWEWRETCTLNTLRFKEAEPELYAQLFERYMRDSSGRVFLLDRIDLSGDADDSESAVQDS